jgi:guanylate kinase
MNKGKLIVLSAPSGTGKTTICKELLKRNKNWLFSISVTTRDERDGEIPDKDYIFITNEKFDHLIKFGDLLEYEWVHGNRYGTLMSPLEDAIDHGKVMLLDIDVKGSCSLMEEFGDDVTSIFIEPPGEDINEQIESIEERLKNRGHDSETLIKQRTKRLQLEIEYKEIFHYHFINDDLNATTDKIEKTIRRKIK